MKTTPACLLDPPPKPRQDRDVHPLRTAVAISAIGYAVLAAVLLGIGLLLTHALSSSVGRWDDHVNSYLARHRTSGLNAVTKVATESFNTLPVVLGAAVVAGLLALRRHWREAAFLVVALVL